jgi:V/A-type H+-transporting ATPase subunit D
MNPSEIAPTKTNLFDYKGQLSFSIDGHNLLEEKRDVLVMHLMETVAQMKEVRGKLNQLLEDSYRLLDFVRMELGEHEMTRIVLGSRDVTKLNVVEKSVMGVSIPTIRFAQDPSRVPMISFLSGSESYDRLVNNVREIMRLIVQVAQVEASAWRLAFEIKKTQRRVNALENVFIPEFREIIKFIQDTLEERERETFFQMKRIKNAKEGA